MLRVVTLGVRLRRLAAHPSVPPSAIVHGGPAIRSEGESSRLAPAHRLASRKGLGAEALRVVGAELFSSEPAGAAAIRTPSALLPSQSSGLARLIRRLRNCRSDAALQPATPDFHVWRYVRHQLA